MSPKIIEQLAPKGVLRVAINLSNFLLVTDRSAEGNPAGVSPDMAAEVARRLGVGIEYVEYKTPGEIADDAGKDAWTLQISVRNLKGQRKLILPEPIVRFRQLIWFLRDLL